MSVPSKIGDRIPLKDAVEFLDHLRKPVTESERIPGPYPYYGANGQQDSVAGWLFDEPLILLAEDGGHFDDLTRSIAYPIDGKCWVNNHAHVLRPKPGFDQKYVSWQLAYYPIMRWITGTTRGKLTKSAAETIPIMAPPLPEQRRIAAILDQADAIRRKRREAIALTGELLRSVFLEMFGDPVANPKGWPVGQLGDVIESITPGWSAAGEERTLVGNEYGVLKVSAVTSGWFRGDEYKAVAADAVHRSLVIPKKGDLLFSRANTRELVAASCIVTHDEDKVFLPDKLWRIETKSTVLRKEVLLQTLQYPRFRHELTKKATGTSGSMLNVSQDKLTEMKVPLYPRDKQDEFSSVFWRTIALREQLHQATVQSEQLFHSLVHRAFHGEL